MNPFLGLVFFTCAMWSVVIFGHALKKKEKRDLLKDNPEALLRLEEIENQRRQMRNAALTTGVKAGVGITALIVKAITKK